MKISKLFHWLYAILMFLPIMVFIPNAFYYGFNEHAVAQEKTEQVPVYYETNDINSVNDFRIGNVYYWGNNFPRDTSLPNGYYFYLKYTDNLSEYGVLETDEIITIQLDDGYLYLKSTSSPWNSIISQPLYFVIENYRNGLSTMPQSVLNHFSRYDGKVIKEYQTVETNMSISDSMAYAWKSTWQNDLFSWSYDSFLTQPFLYITNLFNVPPTNTLLYCLSYWLNISIIWLVFDVVLYVPLLVHRWLDKGIVE